MQYILEKGKKKREVKREVKMKECPQGQKRLGKSEMSTMMLKVEEFVKRNSMSEREKEELLEILNEPLLEISRVIMENSKVKEKKEVEKSSKRYKSKKAEEYAEEHGLRLEDFEMNEISKKDVETKVREMTKEKKEKVGTSTFEKKKSSSELEEGSKDVKREKVICSGINKKGEACKSVGTIKPEGAKKKYCFRHAEDFKSFECDTDSSDDEEEECKNSESIQSDEELKEE